jgi:hypothetical protein
LDKDLAVRGTPRALGSGGGSRGIVRAMKPCPHCGTQNPPEAVGCVHCGKGLVSFDQTVVGFAVPAPEPRFRGTMIGMAPPSGPQPSAPYPPTPGPNPVHGQPPPQPAPVPPAAGGLRQTMIGIAPSTPSGQMAGYPYAAPAPIPTTTAKYPTPPTPPTPPPAAQRPPAPQPPIPPGAATQPQIASSHKTILGVARPGIAPLNPGQPKPSTAVPASVPISGVAPTSRVPSSPRPVSTPSLTTPAAPPKRGVPLVAAIAMIGAAGLFAAAAVVWLFYHGHGPIEAHATALADGSEKLELSCAACEDGSVARLDAASATFSKAHASLALSRPLKVGENPMTITLTSAHGKQSFVDISVPVAYRVRGDTSGLDAATPELRVLVGALPGSAVTVDNKPLVLNADGEGVYVIDVSALVTGFDPTVKSLERRVPYAVTPPKGPTQDGTVTLQTGITPLVIDAPGPAVVLEGSNFVLAGRTAKAGALAVGDRPITVDGAGRFAQMMNVSAPGETTIMLRATSKDSAPRLFPLRVRRVDSLAREAERVRARATNNYAAIADQTETKRGWAVALDGSVVDARTENYSTVVVMDVQSGCAHDPCLARITYGAPFSLARSDKFSAFGSIDGVVNGPRTGTLIPEIRADFLLKASK